MPDIGVERLVERDFEGLGNWSELGDKDLEPRYRTKAVLDCAKGVLPTTESRTNAAIDAQRQWRAVHE